jgi:hypothetical protein
LTLRDVARIAAKEGAQVRFSLEEKVDLLTKVRQLAEDIAKMHQSGSPLAADNDVVLQQMEAMAAGCQLFTMVRVPGDRGTVSIQGEPPAGKEYLGGSECPDCGRVGHVYYHSSNLEAWCRYGKRWSMHASVGMGDAICECVWCGASFTSLDLHGPDDTYDRLRQFRRDYPAKAGYQIRIDRGTVEDV